MTINETPYPWPFGIMHYQGQYGTDGESACICYSYDVPAVTLYLLAQKQIIAGLTSGAVKG